MFNEVNKDLKDHIGDVEYLVLHDSRRDNNIITDELARIIRNQPYITHVNSIPYIIEESKLGQIVWHRYKVLEIKDRLSDSSKYNIMYYMRGKDCIPIFNVSVDNKITSGEYRVLGKSECLIQIDNELYKIFHYRESRAKANVMYAKRYTEPKIF